MKESIRADNLRKSYAGRTVLDGVSLAAYPGEWIAIYGHSGAGKSALLRVLAGIERPDEGTVRVEAPAPGLPCRSVPGGLRLSVFEILWLNATLYGISRAKRRTNVRTILEAVGMEAFGSRYASALSDGERRRLEFAVAMLSPSPVLLLDEPMAGLDPETRQRMWEHLARLRRRDRKTIIVATSRPEDAEVCERIALLSEGRILASGSLQQLRAMVGPEAMVVEPLKARVPLTRGQWAGVVGTRKDDSLVLEFGPDARPAELLRELPEGIAAVRLQPRTVDSVLRELASRAQEGAEER